ncbi:hypothetical protein [Dysgonomonas sp. ZJ709]|uniref:hypothetical protein n=1 Tax=Dysgonomonas sp. ZJ709 TaxID=2709797 RepID=UPI0013EC27B9|nr:hypothetical protein [Dysgonomonas sp. ZJ709]
MKYILICITLFFCGYFNFSCYDNKPGILKIDVKGIITDIYQDRGNHEVYTFNVEADSWYDGAFIADFYPRSWEYAAIGDSIIKNKGETFITIRKSDGSSKIFETRVK